MYLHFLLISIIAVLVTSFVLVLLFYDVLNSDLRPSLTSLFVMILPAVIGILVFVVIFIYIFSTLLTSKILAPIKTAAENIESILMDKQVAEASTYDELRPFINTIKVQKKEITSYINRLIESEKIRSEFTANVSHELKTPLTSINGYAEMIASGITTKEDAIKFANIINKEGLRLLELIDDIINLSQVESIKHEEMKDYFEPVDVYEIAKKIVSDQQKRAEEKSIDLELVGESTNINGNRRMIENLISNLVDNSIKYNRLHGKVRIEINKETDTCILKVKDTGIGISYYDKDRVFERFYRVDKSRSKKIGGTGIGLSIVKHIVEKHGGEITLKSKLNIGTEIEIILPLQ